MNMRSIDMVNIVPGDFCNFSCRHCVNESGPTRSGRLSSAEIELLVRELNQYRPKMILFTGGEPTLHIQVINQILDRLTYSKYEVKITTNGWFAKTEDKLEFVLSSLARLNWVQLSYDIFHGSKLNLDDVRRLAAACSARDLRFNIGMCISEAMDLVEAHRLTKELGLEVIYQKVAGIGRARKTGTEFKHPRFDRSVCIGDALI
ncbi:MAG: radical SAM protein [Calothrix sp. SM1_5_4]|nr:radical SAM protein [Calothrix sp. SM1_5_4]